ncbi:MAG: hypothetical protein GY699_09520 [Desulfobacteraceae bacterium]|nr:hypothetical protein [Desulfobacteraceae bacterium]
MKIEFLIKDQKICSLNSAYVTKDRTKSVETRNWLYNLRRQIYQKKEQVDLIKNNFDRKDHFLVIEYTWFIPRKEFFTKKGYVNTRSGDWSNFAKLPDDEIFDRILGIDDGTVCKGSVLKLPWNGDKHHIKITIWMLDLIHLEKRSNIELPECLRA